MEKMGQSIKEKTCGGKGGQGGRGGDSINIKNTCRERRSEWGEASTRGRNMEPWGGLRHKRKTGAGFDRRSGGAINMRKCLQRERSKGGNQYKKYL